MQRRTRGELPRSGRLAVGPGRGPARRRVVRRHERRGRVSGAHRRRGAQRQGWCPIRSSRRRSLTGRTSSRCNWTSTTPARSTSPKQLRQKVGINGEEPGEIENGRVKLYVIGQGALGAAATQATKHDIAQAEQWNLPIVLIVLLAVFGSLAAAAMPLVLGICTVVVTMGLVYLLSMYTTMSVFVTSTVSMFGIALAIDYSLFILMRFREELRAGRDPEQAADAAMATSGLAVVLSGLTVIASVTGIYLIQTPVLVVDGHRRDPRGRRGGADVDDADAGGPGDVRPGGGQTVVVSALVAAAGDHPVAVLDALDRLGDAAPVAVGAGGVGAPAHAGRPGVLDGARQQHAAPVRPDPRDPRRGERGGRGARSRRARAGAGAGELPRRQRRVGALQGAVARRRCGSEWRRRPTSCRWRRRCSATTTATPCCRRCCRWTPRTWAPAKPSTGCAHELPSDARPGRRQRRRRRADRADQGLRRPGVRDPAAGVRVRRADRVRDAADLDPVGVPGAQGRLDDGAVGGGRLRQPGRRLPVGLAGGAWASNRSRRWTAPSRRWCWR